MLLCTPVYSKETIKIIVPQPAGGMSDIVSRYLQKSIMENEDINVLVVYKPGGEFVPAVNETINDRSDYVLLISGPSLIYKALENDEFYKKVKSLTPVGNVYNVTNSIVVNKNSKFKSWQELLQYSKNNNINVGINAIVGKYIAPEIFPDSKINLIPFAGDSATINNVLNNTLDVGIVGYASSNQFVLSKELNLLGVTHENSMNVPHVISPSGTFFVGFFAAPSMSQEKIKKINKITTNVLKTKETQDYFTKIGVFNVKDTSQENFEKVIDKMMKK